MMGSPSDCDCLGSACRSGLPSRSGKPRRIGFLVSVLVCLAIGTLSSSAFASGLCPNEQVRAEAHSAGLPDCRAYELVSPAYKEGHPLLLGAVRATSAFSADGSHVIVESLGAFAGTEDVPNGAELGGASYELSRTGLGWATEPLTPPASRFVEDGNQPGQLVSSDLGTTTWVLNTSRSGFQEDLYLRGPNGSLSRMGPTTPPGATEGAEVFLLTGSRDLSHILFSLTRDRWPGDATLPSEGHKSVYESVAGAGGGEPKLIGVRNNGPLASNSEAELISQCGTETGEQQPNWISASGTTIFFRALGRRVGDCGTRLERLEGCESEGLSTKECEVRENLHSFVAPVVSEVYARVDGSKTIPISEPSPILCSTPACVKAEASERQEAFFAGASEDGARVFFTTTQPLLDSDGDATNDLYEAEIASGGIERLTQISHGDASDPTPGTGAGVLGVSATSEDGGRVYFVAEGVLTAATNGAGQGAVSGSPNMYMVEPTTGRISFVATLLSSDTADWTPGSGLVNATPDGRFLVFDTGEQTFEYDSQTGALAHVASEVTPGFDHVSNDGARVFFESSAALVPGALSDPTKLFQNIYEYSDGHVSLISDGADVQGEGDRLIGIDASGENVFFETYDHLVSQDTDTQKDIYDARIGGGFPALAVSAVCSGDGCHGSSITAPSLSAPASLTQAGGGNLLPAVNIPKPPVPKPLSRAQKLAKALKACKHKLRKRRPACVKQARKRYGSRPKAQNGQRGGK
jgi:hypothetical protein